MDDSVKKDIRLVIAAGVTGSIYFRLTAGQLLLYFVHHCLQIPKADWALAASIMPLVGALHLVSTYVTEHLRRRKLQSLLFFAVARLATPAIALLPFVTGQHETRLRLFYLAAALIAQGSCNALASSAWLSWVTDIVPEERRGKYYSTRFTLSAMATVVAGLCAGPLIDWFDKAHRIEVGYAVLFGVAFVIGELDLLVHSRVADRPMPEREKEEGGLLLPLLVAPWRHSGFRSLMFYRSMLTFANGLMGPFAIFYLMEELHLKATHLAILGAVMLAVRTSTFWLWRIIGDRVGYRTIALITSTLSGVGVLYWWFLPGDSFAVFFTVLVVARVFFGFTGAGSVLATSTLNMNVAPDKHRSTYFAQVTMIVAVTSALGIFCGRWIFLHVNPASDVYLFGTKLTGVHVLVGLTGILRLLAIRLFYRGIPDEKSEAAMPRINRILRTNARRIVPTLITLERPMSTREREQRIDAMRRLIPAAGEKDPGLEGALRTVLKEQISEEEEFFRIMDQVRTARGRGIKRMTNEIAESGAMHLSPARARAASTRLQRLFAEGDLAGCLRAVRRLAHQTADEWDSPMASSALPVIDALGDAVAAGEEPREEAVLLAVYAYLQLVREPDDSGS